MYVGAGGGMCHVLVTVFPPLYRSLSKRVPVGRVRQHHSAHTLVLKKLVIFIRRHKKKMLKSDGLFECTQTTKREGQLFCLFHKIELVRPSSLKSSLLISTPPRSVLCVLLGKKHVLFIRMRLRGHCGNSRWMHPM